ncbi:MAG: MazF family transcriptional regulator [Gammaproteobacteria bacterium RIFCSPHIGHO2_12_FULL_37_34]|nr:MAG: MazF family transcriptional regulator [Gammaproteobacteria bacterium RIFCSPHIGHO2_12_FULL_37_34]
MKRGEIYFAHLDPTIGTEIRKKRPMVIVSNNANNKAASTITIVPITSNTNKVYPFEVFLETKDSGLSKCSKAQCQQIRTISKIRIKGNKIGLVSQETLFKINAALKLHLGL